VGFSSSFFSSSSSQLSCGWGVGKRLGQYAAKVHTCTARNESETECTQKQVLARGPLLLCSWLDLHIALLSVSVGFLGSGWRTLMSSSSSSPSHLFTLAATFGRMTTSLSAADSARSQDESRGNRKNNKGFEYG